jgi:predicted ribosomally synthesized peptide with SipW-like signal peptide
MKKIMLISFALVLALGGLGVGYALWSDTVTVSGPVSTGVVRLGFTNVYSDIPSQCGEDPNIVYGDWEFTGWVYTPGAVSCPPEYNFGDIHAVEECKNVGKVKIGRIDANDDGCYELLSVNITDAYPYYCAWISCHVVNCGTIPVRLYPVVLPIIQDNGILIKWGDSYGAQIEPEEDAELSFYVCNPQHLLEWNPEAGGGEGRWEMTGPLLPQNTDLGFTINIGGVQWNEY